MSLMLLLALLGGKPSVAVHDDSYRGGHLTCFQDLDEHVVVPGDGDVLLGHVVHLDYGLLGGIGALSVTLLEVRTA